MNTLAANASESLKALQQKSEELEGVYHPLSTWADAANERGIADHLQGIAVCDSSPNRFFLTTSAKGGLLLSGKVMRDSDDNVQYVVDSQSDKIGGNHPGGIQSFGDYVVVPVYDTNSGTIQPSLQLWAFDSTASNHLTGHALQVNLQGHRPYCVGITHHNTLGCLLSVGIHPKGRLVRLYRKVSGNLADDSPFVRTCTVRTRKPHRNNISLCVDNENQVCLLGFRLSGPYQSLGFGEDRIDSYVLGNEYWDVPNASNKPIRVARTYTRHLRCRRGGEQPSFRWGVSARVLRSGSLEITTCGYQIFFVNVQRVFEVDVFRDDTVP